MNADNIIVIGDEGIVEQGSHLDLLKRGTYYYRLCARQGVVDSTHPKNGALATAVFADADFTDAAEGNVTADCETQECDDYDVDNARCPRSECPKDSSNLMPKETEDIQQGGQSYETGKDGPVSCEMSPNGVPAHSANRGKRWKPGAAEFIPRFQRTQGHDYPQSCLTEIHGNQDMRRYAERQQCNQDTVESGTGKGRGIINDEKENLLSQTDPNATDVVDWHRGGSGYDEIIDKNAQKPRAAEKTAVMIRTPRHRTPRSRKLTKSEPTESGLSIDRSVRMDSEGSNNSGLAEVDANAQPVTLAKDAGVTSTRAQRRRRRKRHLQSKAKGKNRPHFASESSGYAEQQHIPAK